MTLGRRSPRGLEVDAGIVDDGVHAAEGVDLVGEGARLGRAAEVADGHTPGARGEIGEDGRTLPAARVQHDLVALVQESAGGGEAEPVGGAGDEDASHRSGRSFGNPRSGTIPAPAPDLGDRALEVRVDPLPVDLVFRFGLLLLGRIAELLARVVEMNLELRQPRGGDPPGLGDLLLLRGSQRLLLAGVRIGVLAAAPSRARRRT